MPPLSWEIFTWRFFAQGQFGGFSGALSLFVCAKKWPPSEGTRRPKGPTTLAQGGKRRALLVRGEPHRWPGDPVSCQLSAAVHWSVPESRAKLVPCSKA